MTGKSAPTIKDVNARVEKLAGDFSNGLSLLQEEFTKFKNQQAQLNPSAVSYDSTSHFLDQLKNFQTEISSSLKELSKEIEVLKNDVSVLHVKICNIERKQNAHTILVHGIQEPDTDIYSVVLKFLCEKLKIKMDKSDISFCHRLGKKSPTKDKPRPVVIQFCKRWTRDMIFNNKRLLKGSGVIITEMLTSENLSLFKKAREMFDKRAWTFNGLVYIDVSGNRKLIKSESDITEVEC